MGGPGSSTLGAARDAWRRGDAATAEAQCREALAVADDAAAWTLLGVILRQRDPVAAEEALRHAIDLDSRDADARFHLGNNHAGAEASVRRALALAPDDATILANLGSVLVDREDYEAAEPVLTQVLACDAQHAYAIALLAYCRARLCAWEGLATLHSQ